MQWVGMYLTSAFMHPNAPKYSTACLIPKQDSALPADLSL